MPKKSIVQPLFIYLNNILIGKLLPTSSRDYILLYEKEWLQQNNARPISLSLPLTEAPIMGQAVYNFFDNLLPDSELIRRRIQSRFQLPSNRCFDLLAKIGGDCIGALQLLTEPLSNNIQTIQAEPIDDTAICALLKNHQNAPLGMDRETDFRISIAGAQEKTALLWHKNKWHLPIGITPTSHIIKLPIGRIEHAGLDLGDSVENEWLCLQILSAFGLPVNHAVITHFNEVKTLILERFDRRWNNMHDWLMRLPQEDMCQALGKPSALKYESDGGPGIAEIMALLRGSYNAEQDRVAFMKTNFLFWMLGAIDGHAKNFSVAIKANGYYHLTPLYDVLSAYPMVEKKQLVAKKLVMAMAVKGKNTHYHWATIQKRHWLMMAQQCDFPLIEMQSLIDKCCDHLDSVINQIINILPKNFPAYIADAIFSGMCTIKNKCIL